VNSGDFVVRSTGPLCFGIYAQTLFDHSPLSITNSGDFTIEAANYAFGIFAVRSRGYGPLSIANSGDFTVTSGGLVADGISAATYDGNSPLSITNSGNFAVTGLGYAFGITAKTLGSNSPLSIENSGDLIAISTAGYATALYGRSVSGTSNSPVTIENSAELTNSDDTFINEKGGVFETKLTSTFGGGNDLFRNEEGGTVLAATNRNASEYSSFVGLERFENKGLISLHDGQVGDVFRISNTVGGTDLSFVGSGKSTLAIDAFLGGPGSNADNFIIDGNVAGTTALQGADANKGPGVLNKEGIPVIFVNGPGVTGDEFFLKKPIDTGFFNYDLFFRPTGSGVFELRSFLGGGVFVLPQLETAMQDMWHQGSDTWFAKVDVTFGEDIDGVGGKAGMRVAW
jgi:autotransporter family porin